MGTGSNPSVKLPRKGPVLVTNFSNVSSTSRLDSDDMIRAESAVVPVGPARNELLLQDDVDGDL